jgi:hypothetical protein
MKGIEAQNAVDEIAEIVEVNQKARIDALEAQLNSIRSEARKLANSKFLFSEHHAVYDFLMSI